MFGVTWFLLVMDTKEFLFTKWIIFKHLCVLLPLIDHSWCSNCIISHYIVIGFNFSLFSETCHSLFFRVPLYRHICKRGAVPSSHKNCLIKCEFNSVTHDVIEAYESLMFGLVWSCRYWSNHKFLNRVPFFM